MIIPLILRVVASWSSLAAPALVEGDRPTILAPDDVFQALPGSAESSALCCQALTHLRSLQLNSPKVTDKGLKELESLKELTSLQLSSTQVTDEGLKALVAARPMSYLYLGSTKVGTATGRSFRTSGPPY